jgi:flagellar hook-associated protein 2
VPIGSHTLLVTRLARADRILSSSVDRTATGIVDAQGAGDKTLQVTVNGVTTDVTVSLVAGDTNDTVLSKVASALNSSGAKVSASVVAVTPTTSRLVLTGAATGSANAVSLQDTSGTLLDAIGLTDSVVSSRTIATSTTGGYQTADATTLDSTFTFDGVDIVRGTNTVNDVVTGLTLELKAPQLATDTPVTLVIGSDKENIRERVEKFITAYNEALAIITSKTAVDPANGVREILAGDSGFRSLRYNFRGIMGGSVSGVLTGNPSLLSQIGIKAAADGSLSIADTTKFDDAVATNAAGVSDLFASTSGVAVRLRDMVDGFTSGTGVIERSRDTLSSQVKYLTDRITRGDAQITKKADRFREEYARVQSTLIVLSQQQSFIDSIVSGSLYYG